MSKNLKGFRAAWEEALTSMEKSKTLKHKAACFALAYALEEGANLEPLSQMLRDLETMKDQSPTAFLKWVLWVGGDESGKDSVVGYNNKKKSFKFKKGQRFDASRVKAAKALPYWEWTPSKIDASFLYSEDFAKYLKRLENKMNDGDVPPDFYNALETVGREFGCLTVQ